MSFETTTNRMAAYTGNGATTSFSVTFPVRENTDLVVYTITSGVVALKALTSDYTVGGLTNNSGITVNFVVAPASGVSIIILRVRPLTQTTDIKNQGNFYPILHERAFDHFVMIDQQQQDELNRALKLSPAANPSVVSLQIPYATSYADKFFKFNAAGTAIELVSASDISDAFEPVSSTHNFTDGQSATALTGVTFDYTVTRSKIFFAEIRRGTSVMAHSIISVQCPNTGWDVVEGGQFGTTAILSGGSLHGLTYSVSQTGTVGTLRVAASNLGGSLGGTIKLKEINFNF